MIGLPLPGKIEQQGLNLSTPKHLNNQNTHTQYLKQWSSTHWASGNKGQ